MRIPVTIIFLLSGFLFAIAFVFSQLFFAFLPAFVLFLHGVQREDSNLRLFMYGTFAGTLLYAGSFFWVWSTYPIQWFSNQPFFVQMSAIGAYWLLTSLAMGISCGVFAVLSKKLLYQTYTCVLFVPIAWVCSEVLRSFLFSIYALGTGGFLNIGFSYGYLGYLLSEVPPLLQLSFIAGVYGLSYIAAVLGVFTFLYVQKRWYSKALYVIPVVVIAAALAFVPMGTINHHAVIGKKVVVFEALFDKTFIQDDADGSRQKQEVERGIAQALQYDPDVLLMPEDIRFANTFASADAFWEWVVTQTDKRDIVIVDNGPAVDFRNKQVLRSYIYDLETRSVYFFDKRYLVPQGEYMSYFHIGLLSAFVRQQTLHHILAYANFNVGVLRDNSAYPDHIPGILFCFETMVPYGAAYAKSARTPEFIAHPISHAWFTNPFSLESQLRQMLRVSAVWNNIPVISAGSMTQSQLFLETGAIDEGTVLEETQHWRLRSFQL